MLEGVRRLVTLKGGMLICMPLLTIIRAFSPNTLDQFASVHSYLPSFHIDHVDHTIPKGGNSDKMRMTLP